MLITLSRQYSTNGIVIAQMVADRLGIPLYDHELVEEIARRLQVNPVTVDHLYETMSKPMDALLLEWRSSVGPETYTRYLTEAIHYIAGKGDAVLLGRGANFALSQDVALRVRIVAPFELRVAIFRAGSPVSETEARHLVAERDHERIAFVKRVFHHAVDDPHFYDMVLNLGCMTLETATELVVHAAQAQKACRAGATPDVLLPEHIRLMIKAKRPVRPELLDHHS
jgi:cytidylate kinase